MNALAIIPITPPITIAEYCPYPPPVKTVIKSTVLTCIKGGKVYTTINPYDKKGNIKADFLPFADMQFIITQRIRPERPIITHHNTNIIALPDRIPQNTHLLPEKTA